VTTDFGSGSGGVAFALAPLPDGKLVVAGSSGSAFALARYLPNGTLDPTFSSDGKVTTSFASGSRVSALAIQPNGRIVVAGRPDASTNEIALARYLPNGTLDPTFSSDGKVTISFASGSRVSALAIQLNGRIVVAGWSSDASGTNDFVLARYLPNGTLDATFGGDGQVTTDFGRYDFAAALAIQPRDGRLVVAGWSSDVEGFASVFALARYHAITCNGVVATRVGTSGNDTLMGTDGPDVLVGFDGHDTLYGLGGHDLLCGNGGHDTLSGGSGNDVLYGGTDNDTLGGGTGDDTLRGEAGTDECDGGTQVQKDTAVGCESVTGVP
jgi:uncharacterized delta-60 repeat protein